MKNLQYYKDNNEEVDLNLKSLLIIKKPGNNNEDYKKYNLSFDSTELSRKFMNNSQFHTKTLVD